MVNADHLPARLGDPVGAQTPTLATKASDGTYFGVSRIFEEDAGPFWGGSDLDALLSQSGPKRTINDRERHRTLGKARRIRDSDGVLVMRDLMGGLKVRAPS